MIRPSIASAATAFILSMSLAYSVLAEGTVDATGAPSAASVVRIDPAVAGDAEYVLGPGDKIRVITFGEEALTGEFYIGSQGQVSLPLIGDIVGGGQTIAQLSVMIERALANGFLKDPHVSIEVLDFRPFYILGEVNRPGQYPYTSGLTVFKAVATAGGFTYRANTRKVFIKSGAGSAERKMPLVSMTPVQPGDTIRIGERFF